MSDDDDPTLSPADLAALTAALRDAPTAKKGELHQLHRCRPLLRRSAENDEEPKGASKDE